MEKSLNWTKKAFNRTIEFKDAEGKIVGSITFQLFDRAIEASLYDKKFSFDVNGLLIKEVIVTDGNHKEVAVINLGFRGKAEATLANGEKYIWKRNDFFMRQWELIHDLPDTDNDPIIIDYDRERSFVNEEGKIAILSAGENDELLTLIGFFIGLYFIRRRRKVAAVGLIVSV